MKKKIIIGVSSLFIVGLLFLGIKCLFYESDDTSERVRNMNAKYVDSLIETFSIEGEYRGNMPDYVEADAWNEGKNVNVIKVKLEGEKSGVYEPGASIHYFSTRMTPDELLKANKDIFVGKLKTVFNKTGCNLLFKNNNYYELTSTSDKAITHCSLRCINSSAVYNKDETVVFQMPGENYFDVKIVDSYKENKVDLLEGIYFYQFKDLKEFYKRFDKKYCSIDEENQIIRIAGRNLSTHKIIKDFATIDYKNHRVITKESRGRKAYWESDKVYIK
ncbi:hypothetical protein [Eubacterium xylanophilum]|uniref:hypothetical protein n=1 Tax=Eubacterium xylanophilum TaxID=39497 RepID=UPI0004BA2421|nr:hypothetical protein [Eubacterium xylanophilum]